jgi:hypothetical protein
MSVAPPTAGSFWRIACLALAALTLAGCIVVPAPGYYPWHSGRGYYR